MTVYRLPRAYVFPDPREAEPDGLLAVGGDLSVERLLTAYASGVFPWFTKGRTPYWFSPDPRLVLRPEALHVPRSLERTLRRGAFGFSADRAFERVIRACAATRRPGQRGTWISAAIVDGYLRLHEAGFAHSFEAWEGEALVGGLYGVSLGAAFFGESMFAARPDASKAAFVTAVRALAARGLRLVDCQVTTEHLLRFGAEEWPRDRYLAALPPLLEAPTWRGPWTLEPPGP
ncbi:MAG: leucyl/phenylalanyl-tRNA--protein transferase [Anaeromyxobacteraceae bacterium]|nr:leucyl/phenylalanyl-tRNA--protein transferase [Anaeromyxobacteraceae bacterium]